MIFTILPTNFTTVEAENDIVKIQVGSDCDEKLVNDRIDILIEANDTEIERDKINKEAVDGKNFS